MIDALRSLATADLTALAAALRAGRLAHPPSTLALEKLCSTGNIRAISENIAALAGEGMSAAHLALLLESIAAERSAQPSAAGDVVDLVWSGPEAPGTASRDTGAVVRELFRSASSDVLVAGYAVYQGKAIFATLAERMDVLPALRVRLFLDVARPYKDTTVASDLRQRFVHRFKTEEWPKGHRLPEVYHDPRSLELTKEKRTALHAKCIVVDRQKAFVSSANFTEAAQTRNIEVGVLIDQASFAQHLASHFDRLVEAGGLVRLGVG